MSLRILFVTHDSCRTGAPLFLLNFLRWLREFHAEIGCDLLIRQRGELDQEYMTVADKTYHWQSKSRLVEALNAKGLVGKRRGVLDQLLRHLSSYEKKLLTRLGHEDYDLVFVNSFANARLIPLLASFLPGKPIICRAPELERWVEDQIGVGSVLDAIPHIDRYIAVSDLVFGYLNSGLNIPREKIIKIPGFIRKSRISMQKPEVRHRLGVADDAFLVCGCGTLDWRKGADLFIQVAAEIERRYPDREIWFCWIGGAGNLADHRQLQFDLDMLKLSRPVLFVPSTDAFFDYLSASDLFALTSREDPFPLVALEAASCALPIVCFDAAVGSKEFVDDRTGMLVPYLDIAAFAEAIAALQEDHERYASASDNIQALSRNYSIDRICNQLLQCILAACHPERVSLEKYS